MKRWLLPVSFAALVALLGYALTLDPTRLPSALIGRALPAFNVPALDGSSALTDRDLASGVTVLNVWASWCGGCATEHPVLMSLARQPGIALYGLNYRDDARDARRWLARHGDPYRAVGVDAPGRVAMDLGVYGVPETFVIDAHGTVRYRHAGPLTEEIIRDEIAPLVEGLGAESRRVSGGSRDAQSG